MSEQLGPSKEITWGLPKPTVLFDAQSAPPLLGIPAEQVYTRMPLMGGPKDIAFVNYHYDQRYYLYLQTVLGLELPQFHAVEPQGRGSLTLDVLSQPHEMQFLRALAEANFSMQFFNLTQAEVELARQIGNPTYIANLESTLHLGSKTGFKQFCFDNGIPTPRGAICHSKAEVIAEIKNLNSPSIVKADLGTGGEELGSNVIVTVDDIQNGTGNAHLEALLHRLNPSEPPYVVEQILKLPEASLHFFLGSDGQIIYKPDVYGQLAHDNSYVGGYYPNNFNKHLMHYLTNLAHSNIIPALKKSGTTGFHCMDFLYDPSTSEVFFIEDNTRPGALDFIAHLTSRIAEKNKIKKHAWHHQQLPLKNIGLTNTTAEKILFALSDMIVPQVNGGFVAISNPDVLPFGYGLHLTALSTGDTASTDNAKIVWDLAVQRLKQYGSQ